MTGTKGFVIYVLLIFPKMKTEKINVAGAEYLVKIHYEKRNNARVSVNRNAVNIRIPFSFSREEQFKQVLKMKAWAIKKLQENPSRFKQEIQKEYKDGDVLKVGEEEYNLRIEFRNKASSSSRSC